MEETQPEETTTPRASSYPPWLDLPDPLTELILDRLPLLYCLPLRRRLPKLAIHPKSPPPPLLSIPSSDGPFPPLPHCFSPSRCHLHPADYYLVLHCAGKFYCVSESLNLYVIHPLLPVPSVQILEMDASQLLPYDETTDVFRIQELNSEISVLF